MLNYLNLDLNSCLQICLETNEIYINIIKNLKKKICR